MTKDTPSGGTEARNLEYVESARIVSEICARLDELEQLRPYSARLLVASLDLLGTQSPSTFLLTIQLLHADERALHDFSAQARRRGVSKQAIHQQLKDTLSFMRTISPALADYAQQIRDKKLHREDPAHPPGVALNGAVRTYEHSHSNGGSDYQT